MFVRVKKLANGKTKVQIVINNRINSKKTKQTVVKHIGQADNPQQLEYLKKLGEIIKLDLLASESKQPSLFNLKQYNELINKNRIAADSAVVKFGVDLAEVKEQARVLIGV